jgi:hypothetical protein
MSAADLYVLPISHGKSTEGIPLEILREALEDPPASFTFSTFSMLLGRGASDATKALSVLLELGYIRTDAGPPTVYQLTSACVRLLSAPALRAAPIAREEALRGAGELLAACGQGNSHESLCRVVAVTFFGAILHDSIKTVAGVSAQVTVTVKRSAKVAQAMRELEAMLLSVHNIIQLHIVLVADSP